MRELRAQGSVARVDRVVSALYLVAAAGNLLPVIGVLSAARLEALYGVAISDPSLIVLLRHRAVLLGIVGALIAAAAFRPALRKAAVAAGFASMLSFMALAWGAESNAALRRVAGVDVALCAALGCAALLDARARATASRSP
jgi:hypothetical protein